MGMRPTLARNAVIRGDVALMTFREVIASGGNDLAKLRSHGYALDRYHATTRATYAAQALGDALERGIEDPAYRNRLVSAYCARIDELEPTT